MLIFQLISYFIHMTNWVNQQFSLLKQETSYQIIDNDLIQLEAELTYDAK
jgi:hypothetical protein